MTGDRSRRGASSTSRPRPSSSSPRSAEGSSTSASPGSASWVRDLADRHGVRPSKSLGQHFLIDPNLARAIVADAGVGPGARAVEVGAGLGSLTVALADAGAAEVLAIEFDRTLLPALEEVAADRTSVRVLHADATRVDWQEVLGDGPWILCANLPYNVGTSIALDLLSDAPSVDPLVVMVQHEVGERLAAGPGEDAYSAVSLRVAYHARAAQVRRVPPQVFWPRPAVESVIVRLDRLAEPAVGVEASRVWRVVDASFAQRRKTMRNALRRMGADPSEADELLRAAGIDPDARPESLSIHGFAALAEALPA